MNVRSNGILTWNLVSFLLFFFSFFLSFFFQFSFSFVVQKWWFAMISMKWNGAFGIAENVEFTLKEITFPNKRYEMMWYYNHWLHCFTLLCFALLYFTLLWFGSIHWASISLSLFSFFLLIQNKGFIIIRSPFFSSFCTFIFYFPQR